MARVSKAQVRNQRQRQRDEERRRQARGATVRNVAIAASVLGALVIALVLLWPESEVGNTSETAWDLPELDGDGRVAIADFRGTPTVVAFFASWCEVCEEEIPQYLAVSQQLGDKVQFVGINTQDSGNGLGDAEKWGIAGEWPLARDIGGTTGNGLNTGTLGMRGSPSTAFYDEDGNLVHFQRGGLTGAQLVDALDQLFGIDA